jgi:hypothetical protein
MGVTRVPVCRTNGSCLGKGSSNSYTGTLFSSAQNNHLVFQTTIDCIKYVSEYISCYSEKKSKLLKKNTVGGLEQHYDTELTDVLGSFLIKHAV